MTTSTPNPDDAYDAFRPGVCECCGATAPVIPGLWYPRVGPIIGLCETCHNARLNAPEEWPDSYSDGSDDGPSAWYPGVEADHPDWY